MKALGIPDHEKAKVRERFYRDDASWGAPRTSLSLVAVIAKLHGGRLELADNHPGRRHAAFVDLRRFYSR